MWTLVQVWLMAAANGSSWPWLCEDVDGSKIARTLLQRGIIGSYRVLHKDPLASLAAGTNIRQTGWCRRAGFRGVSSQRLDGRCINYLWCCHRPWRAVSWSLLGPWW